MAKKLTRNTFPLPYFVKESYYMVHIIIILLPKKHLWHIVGPILYCLFFFFKLYFGFFTKGYVGFNFIYVAHTKREVHIMVYTTHTHNMINWHCALLTCIFNNSYHLFMSFKYSILIFSYINKQRKKKSRTFLESTWNRLSISMR